MSLFHVRIERIVRFVINEECDRMGTTNFGATTLGVYLNREVWTKLGVAAIDELALRSLDALGEANTQRSIQLMRFRIKKPSVSGV